MRVKAWDRPCNPENPVAFLQRLSIALLVVTVLAGVTDDLAHTRAGGEGDRVIVAPLNVRTGALENVGDPPRVLEVQGARGVER